MRDIIIIHVEHPALLWSLVRFFPEPVGLPHSMMATFRHTISYVISFV
jgi:hypothetical protein